MSKLAAGRGLELVMARARLRTCCLPSMSLVGTLGT
jgi:hypothetical protein